MHLDNGHDKAGDVAELGHVDGEVLELVLPGLVQHQARAVAHGVDAPQVPGRVEGWVRGAWQRYVWEAGGPRAVGGGGARGAQRAIGRVGLAAARRDGGLGALAVEQTHGGQVQSSGRAGGRGQRKKQCWRRSSRGRFGTQARSVEGAQKRSTAVQQDEPRSSWRGSCAGPPSCLSVAAAGRLLGAPGMCGQRNWTRLARASIMQGARWPASGLRVACHAWHTRRASAAAHTQTRAASASTAAAALPISLPRPAPCPRHDAGSTVGIQAWCRCPLAQPAAGCLCSARFAGPAVRSTAHPHPCCIMRRLPQGLFGPSTNTNTNTQRLCMSSQPSQPGPNRGN